MVTNDIEKVKVILYKKNGEILTDVTDNKSVVDFLASVMNFAPIEKKEAKISNSDDLLYVDLGLPSGLKWAKCNVGAKKETDYGDYFMWGSAEPNTKTTCNWMKNPFNNGSDSCDEEYFNAHKSEWLDDNDNLKSEYDAARANMGGDWRMPTRDDFQELLDNTDSEWIGDYNGTGVDGMKFTPKTDTSKWVEKYNGSEINGMKFT